MKEDHGLQLSSEDEVLEDPDYQDVMAAQKISFNDIRDHMTGPLISFVAHVMIFVFLGSMVVFEGVPERHEIEVEVKDMEFKEVDKIPEPPEFDEITGIEDEKDFDRPDISPEVDVPVEDVVIPSTPIDIVLPNVFCMKESNSPILLPAQLQGRTEAARKKAMDQYDGRDTEGAVIKSLCWLVEHQNPDGSWGEAEMCKPAFTGWAVLAFLAHGETPSSVKFGRSVLNGIKRLVEYGNSPNPVAAGASGYGHMIFTYALAEAYALTKIPMLEAVLDKNIALTVRGQNIHGGYDYSYGQSGRNDTSVLGWASQALKAALAAGATTPGIEHAMEKIVKNLKGPVKATRGFVYSNEAGKPVTGNGSASMTAVGTLVLQLFGEGKSQEAQDGLSLLLESYNKFGWDSKQPWALYTWYYQTQAYFQGFEGKGRDWRKWNKMFKTELLAKQKEDGHWDTPAKEYERKSKGVEKGHGEGMFSELDTAVYATCLSCLMLTVYYRYLPTFKVVEAGAEALGSDDGNPGRNTIREETKIDDDGLLIE